MMKILRSLVASAAFFIASSALAQNAGTVTNHAFAIGKGPGTQGFTSLICGTTQLPIGQSSADPICAALSGDITMNASGVTAIGANKVTNSQLATMAANTTKCNATAGTAAPTDCTASTMRTNIGVAIGSNVQAWDTDLDCLAALSSTGVISRTGGGTCSAGALALSGLATGTQDTVIGYFGSTTASAIAINNCTSALTYSITTHTFGCNVGAGSGNVLGSGTPTVGDLAAFSNTSATAIVGTGYNATQVPGVIPSTATVTITIASPAVITWSSHGLAANTPVVFSTSGALPTGLLGESGLANPVAYYVVGSSITTNTFQVATSIANAKAGIAVNTSGSQSGTQTAKANTVACLGCVGELIWQLVPFGSAISLTSGTASNITSLTVPAGIYACSGVPSYQTNGGAVATEYHHFISTTSAPTIQSLPNYGGANGTHLSYSASQGQGFAVGPIEISTFASTPIYLGSLSTFSGGTQIAYGFLGCRRVH